MKISILIRPSICTYATVLVVSFGCSTDSGSGPTEGASGTAFSVNGAEVGGEYVEYIAGSEAAAGAIGAIGTGGVNGVAGKTGVDNITTAGGMAGVGTTAGSGGIVGVGGTGGLINDVAGDSGVPDESVGTDDGVDANDSGMTGDGAVIVDGDVVGDSGVPGEGGSDETDEQYLPPCLTKPSQVVILGDSYVTMYPDTLLQPRIEALARADGALTMGQTYRNYAVPGTSMANGQIPSQFTSAERANPDIKLVIMDGGGNDVLLGAPICENRGSASNSYCQGVIKNALDAGIDLFAEMLSAGVSDVIFFGYPHVPPNGLLTGNAPNEILDYSTPLSQQNCEAAEAVTGGAMRCYFIDTRPLFGDTYRYINIVDGVHPSAAGADIIAEAIYSIMKENCLAQPASKGCCK